MALTVSVAALVGGPAFHVGHSHAHAASLAGIHKIRHVVVVMQNRSFDSYFGTYPGADGLPRQNGGFTVCVPDPKSGVCQRPYHDRLNRNTGGPHEHFDAIRDIDGGKMDGFLRQARRGLAPTCLASSDAPICSFGALHPDVMGYHDARDPELLDVRAPVRAPGPYVPAGHVLEPARPPLHGLGMVGPLPQAG